MRTLTERWQPLRQAPDDDGAAAPVVEADSSPPAAAEEAPPPAAAAPADGTAPPAEPAEGAGGEPAVETPAEPSVPAGKPWYQKRIDDLTRRAHDVERENAIWRAAWESNNPGKPAPAQQPAAAAPAAPAGTGMLPETEIQRRAAELMALREFQDKTQALTDEGRKLYKDFDETLGQFRQYGGYTLDFLHAAIETGAAPKVLYALARDPDNAMRILGMTPVRQAVELARMADKLTAQAPVSQAPAPIRTVGRTAPPPAPSLEDKNLSMADWIKLRDEQAKRRRA